MNKIWAKRKHVFDSSYPKELCEEKKSQIRAGVLELLNTVFELKYRSVN